MFWVAVSVLLSLLVGARFQVKGCVQVVGALLLLGCTITAFCVTVCVRLAWCFDTRRGQSWAKFFSEGIHGRLYYQLHRWAGIWKLSVEGEDEIAKKFGRGPYVLVANHQGPFDHPMMAQLCKVSPNTEKRYLGKVRDFNIPIFGWTQRLSGDVSVNIKGSQAERQRSLEACKAIIKHGSSLVIYPEGTRNKQVDRHTGNPLPLLEFRLGAFRIARDMGVPVLPVALFGSNLAMHPKTYLAGVSRHMRVVVGPPFSVPKGRGDDDDEGPKQAASQAKTWIEEALARVWSEHIGAPKGRGDDDDDGPEQAASQAKRRRRM